MKFLQFDLGTRHRGDRIQVTLNGSAANVLLMDSSNLSAFKAGRTHRFVGGLARKSPVHLTVPSAGHWHAVVHLEGLRGNVRASARVLQGPLPAIGQNASSPLSAIRQAAQDFASVTDSVSPASDSEAYDVFISYASEDKDAVARPLAKALKERGLTVWFDEFELRIGDSLRGKIDAGLGGSRFGLVVLSPQFFARGWPRYELDGLVTREVAGDQQLILPVWHEVTAADVRKFSASLAGKVARSTTTNSIAQIADEVTAVVHASAA